MKLPLLIFWAVITTLVRYATVDLPLTIVGLPLIAIMAFFTEDVPHSTYYDRTLLQFKWRWLTWIFCNEEDGVDGLRGGDPAQAWWATETAGWSVWRRIFVWSALRNSANNLRFVPGLSPLFDPARIESVFSSDWIIRKPAPPAWPTGSSVPGYAGSWAVSWQGLYVGIVWQIGTSTLAFGWDFRPGDELGPLMIGSRMPRARMEISL